MPRNGQRLLTLKTPNVCAKWACLDHTDQTRKYADSDGRWLPMNRSVEQICTHPGIELQVPLPVLLLSTLNSRICGTQMSHQQSFYDCDIHAGFGSNGRRSHDMRRMRNTGYNGRPIPRTVENCSAQCPCRWLYASSGNRQHDSNM